MSRRRIELEKGAILPTSRGLWDTAREKLREAESAVTAMQVASERVSYEIAWSQFVDSIEEFWTRFFDEGKMTFTAFQPWAGAIDRERKADETLQYIYQARHQSQHGRIPMSWEAPKLIMGRGFDGRMYGLRIFPDQTYEVDAAPNHPEGHPFLVEHAPGKPVLPTIENKRFKQVFPAPSEHRGEPLIDRSPTAIARAVLSYYGGVLDEAMKTFGLAGDA